MPEKVFLLNKHIFTYFNNKIIECRITSISLGTMDEYLYTVVPINNMGREIKLSEGDMYMTKHELVQELLDKRYVYQDLGSIIEEDIYNNEPYFVDKNLINLNGVARYRYTEEKRNLTEYDEYALIELKKSGLKHLTDTRFIFSKDLLGNYVDVDNLILVKELVNDVLVFSLLRSINGLEVVIHNRVTKEEIIAYFKQVTEAIATYPIKYVYGDAVHITRVVNSFVNSGLNTKINSNSSIINISVNDNTFAKEVQEQEIVNSTQPGRELQNYISEKDAIGEEYANNLIGYLKLINSSDYEDISISDGVFIEPEQTLTITVTTTVNEATGELTLGTNIVTSDGLPIKRTEPLVIDIVTKDGDTPIEYFIPSSITILDFTNNVNSFTVERNTDVSVSDDIVVSIEFNSEEGIVIEGTNPTIIIPKDEVVVPDEPQEINVTFNVTKNVAIKEENYEILATVSTSDGKPFQSVGEEQLKVEFIYSDPDSQSHINEVYTLPITKNTSNQSSAVLSIYRNNKISLDNKTFEILISSEIPGINVTDGRIGLTIQQD